jgi:RNA polymerase sigma-70 factor (ECF subfamily)
MNEFDAARGKLLAIAYRMLGSAAEAEDAVQDTWLRWSTIDASTIRDPGAWLATTLTRVCIDRLTSARARREIYPGTWLPEPVRTIEPLDVESIAIGFLVMLERLTPLERAVFVLARAFDFRHAEIAGVLEISEEASRQALHRATSHLAAGKPRFPSDHDAQRRLLGAFMQAVASGDVERISTLLADDVTLYGDGGGRVRGAILRPLHGPERVARFFVGLAAKTPDLADLVATIEDVNAAPALVGRDRNSIRFVIAIETDGTCITVIRNVVNPEKLALHTID